MKRLAPCLGGLLVVALAAGIAAVPRLAAREQPAAPPSDPPTAEEPLATAGEAGRTSIDGTYRLAKDVSFNCIYVGLDAGDRLRYAFGPTLAFWPVACPAARLLCEKMGLRDCQLYGLFRRG